MGKINVEERKGVRTRFINAQNGIRVYLLPNVPVDAGEIQIEQDFDLESAVSRFSPEHQERARKIGQSYHGRQLDTMSILLYAEERGKFNEFAKRLEAKPNDFDYIHPDLMMARTDVTAFFMQMYVDLGVAPEHEAENAKKLVENYGPGVVVLPIQNKKIKRKKKN